MTDSPVIVSPSPVASQVRAGIRAVLVLSAGLGLSKALPPATLDFLSSNTFAEAVVCLAGIGAVVWAQIEARLHKRVLVAAASAAPDSKFIVATDPPK